MTNELTGQALLDSLKAQAQAAAATGDLEAILVVAGKIKAAKSELAKVEAERIRAESEKLAGVREKVATRIHAKVVADKEVAKMLADTKALGFTFKLDTAEVQYRSVALLVPQAPTTRKGTGGHAGGGKSQVEYGMSLDEIFQKFATNEQKAEVAKVLAGEDKKAANSKAWQLKVQVKKEAITKGTLKPAVK